MKNPFKIKPRDLLEVWTAVLLAAALSILFCWIFGAIKDSETIDSSAEVQDVYATGESMANDLEMLTDGSVYYREDIGNTVYFTYSFDGGAATIDLSTFKTEWMAHGGAVVQPYTWWTYSNVFHFYLTSDWALDVENGYGPFAVDLADWGITANGETNIVVIINIDELAK